MMSHRLLLLLSILLAVFEVRGQSNYANRENSVEYQPGLEDSRGLPEETVLDGKVTKLDDLSPVIFLNRTKAALNCASGSMQVELKFNDKFYGIAYADFDRNSACQVVGKGGYSYKLELPLRGCGTRQDPQRVFTNNIVVRFHPNLEMDGDEVITIVCRYPPPIASEPSAFPIIAPPVAPSSVPAPLNGFHILLIICGILFLSLLLLGLGCSYYCLRRRNVVRQPFSSIGTESEITKLPESDLDFVKIPRAHAPPPVSHSDSDAVELIPSGSDTIPSDYPSESHSEPEDVDTRSSGSFTNAAYVPDSSSFYSESYGHTQIERVQNVMATATTVPRLPLAVKEQPKFDVQVKVKRAPPSPPSLTTSDAESSVTRNLSTIMEQREESVRTMESPPPVDRTQFTYIPELHPPPKYIQPAPVYKRILSRQQDIQESAWDEVEAPRSIVSLNTEMTDTHSMTEIIDESHRKFIAPIPPPPPPIAPAQHYIVDEEQPESLEPPIAVYRKPEVTSHVVDDVFLRTITEKRTIEDIERHKRLVTEYHTRPKPVEDQKWDVTIRNYPTEAPEPPEWENFSDISSASGLTLTPKMERAPMTLPPQSFVDDNKEPLFSPELVGNISQSPPKARTSPPPNYLSTFDIPLQNPDVPNWDVLIRVLQPSEMYTSTSTETAEQFSQLTMTDKAKWRQIITTESTLRTLLTEAVVREDFERIRYDTRYENIFEPPKWDVIIRILAPPDEKPKSRFRKKGDWDNRSRRSSLPTLYEYDSDGGSSMRTLTNEPVVHPHLPVRSRKTSRSSYKSEADLRSMSEMTVDFARREQLDSQSEASSYYPGGYYDDDDDYKLDQASHPSLVRSLSQPSLARSASEFTERWVAPSTRYDTGSEFTSPDTTPKSQRSSRIQPLHVPRGVSERSAVWQEASRVAQGPQGSAQMHSRFVSETSTSFRSKDWFGDNDSEASYK